MQDTPNFRHIAEKIRLFLHTETPSRLLNLSITLALVTTGGMVGFHWIEGWNLIDSLYMAVITLTTVGYGEVHELSQNGRIFVLFYLAISLGVSLYSLATLGEIVLQTNLFKWIGKKKWIVD